MSLGWPKWLFGKPEIRGIVFERDGLLVAVCLDPYLVTQAQNWEQLVERLKGLVAAHIVISIEKGEDPFDTNREAPRKYWEMYKAAAFDGREPIPICPPAKVRGQTAIRLRAAYV